MSGFTNHQVCDSHLVARFLQGQLAESDQEALVEHLDTCDYCCERLSEQSANAEVWNHTRAFLGSSSTDQQTTDFMRSVDTTESPAGQSSQQSLIEGLLAPSDDPRMLGRFGPYEILGIVGAGGMGIVLKGHDAALHRFVALKLLMPQLASDGTARQRFAREAQAAAAVVHDNVIPIFGVNEFNNLPYFVMPYVGGLSLQKRIDNDGPLELAELLRVAAQTAAGLAAAHEQGLIHRDVKPANILLPDGVERVQLTDFGLARAADDRSLTRIGVIAGTPEYMSPEQARGEAVDYRSDLFSLGSVMYTMSTGRPPFCAETSFGILQRISDTDPTSIRESNPELPVWLEHLIQKLHAKSCHQRFDSAEQVAELLNQCLAHAQNSEEPLPNCLRQPPVRRQVLPSDRRSNPSAKWIGLGLAALLVFATIVILIQKNGKTIARFRVPDATVAEESKSGKTPVNERTNAIDDQASDYLNTVPDHALQVKLAHGGAVRLLALSGPGHDAWWAPDGTRLDAEFGDAEKEPQQLSALCEFVFPNTRPPGGVVGPLGETYVLPWRKLVPVEILDNVPVVRAGFGAGPWTSRGKLHIGDSEQWGEFGVDVLSIKTITAVDPEHPSLALSYIKMEAHQTPDIDFALIGVDRNAKRVNLAVTFHPVSGGFDFRNRDWLLTGAGRFMDEDTFSHVELLTRRRGWAEFRDVAIQPTDEPRIVMATEYQPVPPPVARSPQQVLAEFLDSLRSGNQERFGKSIAEPLDSRESKIFYAYERALYFFRRDMIRVHQAAGWDAIRGKPNVTLNPYSELADSNFEIENRIAKAVAHGPSRVPKLYLVNCDGDWRIDLSATIAAKAKAENTSPEKIWSFLKNVTPVVREFRGKIEEGQSIEKLDKDMAWALLPVVFRSGAKVRVDAQ